MTASDEPQRHTLDAFHRGAFWLVQPARGGHRAGMDAMMLAAAVPAGFSGRLADLGAGAGAAGLAVAARCPAARVGLVERAPELAECARLSIAHEANAALADRASVVVMDVTARGAARRAAGLEDHGFDFAIMNPPFNPSADRSSPEALRRSAHVMEPGLFDAWLRTASAVVRPGGGLALIARPESLGDILSALGSRFGAAEIRPIHPRPGMAAIRIVLRAVRGSRRRLALLPPLFMHDGDPAGAPAGVQVGAGPGFSAEADAIGNGQATLFAN